MSRPEFIRNIFFPSLKGTVLIWGAPRVVRWIFGAPGLEEENVRLYPDPGWFETQYPTRPEFINFRNGNKEDLRYFGINDSLLREIVSRGLNSLYKEYEGEPPRLGDILKKYTNYATKVLADNFHQGIKEAVSPSNSIHLGILALSLVYSPYLSTEEKDIIFGVKVKGNKDGDDLKSFYHSSSNIPTVFPIKKEECNSKEDFIYRCAGYDHMVHFAGYLSLIHLYLYFKAHGLQDYKRMPRGAMAYVARSINEEVQATRLARLGSDIWELYETLFGGPLDENGERIPTGLFEKLAWTDEAANTLGLNTAKGLTEKVPDDELRRRLNIAIKYLNSDEINRMDRSSTDKGELPVDPFGEIATSFAF